MQKVVTRTAAVVYDLAEEPRPEWRRLASMRWVVSLGLICAVAPALAQRGGAGYRGGPVGVSSGASGHRGGGPGPYLGGFGLPPVGPIPPLGSPRAFARHAFGRQFVTPFIDVPFGAAGYFDSGYAVPPAQNIVIVEASPPYTLLEQVPPPPIKSEIHEYSTRASAEAAEGATFSIVLNDGSTRSAVALWVQNERLHLIDPEGRREQLPMADVNRGATVRTNRDRGLQLHLPSP
jgi:hypothetical protein